MNRVELILLAARDGFALYERAGCSSDGWRSLKLVRHPRDKGWNAWWFGWDGRRLSRSSDTRHLAERHPEVLQWVTNVLRASGEVR